MQPFKRSHCIIGNIPARIGTVSLSLGKIMKMDIKKFRGAHGAALVAALAAFAYANTASAADHIKVGALKSTNVGAVYVAIDKGYFAKEGLEPELVPFEIGAAASRWRRPAARSISARPRPRPACSNSRATAR